MERMWTMLAYSLGGPLSASKLTAKTEAISLPALAFELAALDCYSSLRPLPAFAPDAVAQ